MKILYVHQTIPSQYRHIIRALAGQGRHQQITLAMHPANEPLPSNVQHVQYHVMRGNGSNTHGLATETESKVIRAEGCALAALQLKKQGFIPDLICAHPGWGEALFLKDVWPDSPILCYQEFYYQQKGVDLDFDPELQTSVRELNEQAKSRMKTANLLLSLQAADWNVTPTQFQKSTFPNTYKPFISVIHDGIDTELCKPAEKPVTLTLPNGKRLHQDMPIVTFVNRRLEPYRGCHTFIRSIPFIQKLQPDVEIVIVGGREGVSYGRRCSEGEWCDYFVKEIEGQYDPDRVHFTGNLSYGSFRLLMQLSQAHVYLTYPFVLSWSLLEAMSTGCAIVGSSTPPVMEVIRHEEQGLLVDFFSPIELADAVGRLLSDRRLAQTLGKQARDLVQSKYELSKCVGQQLALMNLVSNGTLRADC